MARYEENGKRVESGILAQVVATPAGAWTLWYTCGGMANANGINTPALNGAREVIVTIANADSVARMGGVAKVSAAEGGVTSENQRIPPNRSLAPNETLSHWVGDMNKGDKLYFWAITASALVFQADGDELQ